MKEVPEPVSTTFQKMKKGSAHYVELKVIKGRYCLFESTSKWDRTRSKPKKITRYLGSVKEDGRFVPSKKRAPKEGKQEEQAPTDISDEEENILMNLSMNARMPLPMLAKRIGKTKRSAETRVRKAEQKFGIRYIAEPDLGKLGYLEYIALVKFKDVKPTAEEITKALVDEPRVQLAGLTSGEYDLLIYFLAENNLRATQLLYKLRVNTVLSGYESKWTVTPFTAYYGFIPLREKFFEVLAPKVWKRSQGSPRPSPLQITNREFAVLKELSVNAVEKFTEIDEKYGFDRGRSQYTYHTLREKGMIKRLTITMQKLRIKYNSFIFVELLNGAEFSKTRKNLLKEVIAQGNRKITNKFALQGDIEAPDGVLFLMPSFDDSNLSETESEIRAKIKGMNPTSLLVSNFLIGTPCYRLFDNTYADQYRVLIVDYKEDLPSNRQKYESEGRKTRETRGFRGEEYRHENGENAWSE